MPGFTDNPANWQQFWVSFWASLISGTIYSLLVGLVVGFIVWWAQKRSDTLQLRHRCESDLATFREHLRSIFDQADIIRLDKISALPPVLVNAADLLANSPIGLWHDNLPNEQKFIGLLKSFQKAFSNFHSAASNLEAKVLQIIRQFTYSHHISDPLEKGFQSFILGRILGEQEATLLALIGLESDVLPHVAEVYVLVRADEEVNTFIENYREASKRTESAVDALKQSLNAP